MEILVQIVRLYPLGGRLYFPNITAGISPATHAPLWWILSPPHHHQRWSPFSSLSNCDQYNMVEDHDITSQPGQTRPCGFPQHSRHVGTPVASPLRGCSLLKHSIHAMKSISHIQRPIQRQLLSIIPALWSERGFKWLTQSQRLSYFLLNYTFKRKTLFK